MKNGHHVMFGVAMALLVNGSAEAEMTAMERAAQFGLSDIRGIAYIPGPDGPDMPVDPQFDGWLPYFIGDLQTYNEQGQPLPVKLNQKFTIYYDSDFYNEDFEILWGLDDAGPGKGRDDLGRYKAELNANFVHLYDWNADPRARKHKKFLDYASKLGMRVTIPISNFTYQIMCGNVSGDWQKNLEQIFDEVYDNGGTKPDLAAGVLKIFNEYDVSVCKDPELVARAAQFWKELEDERKVPDERRLPIIFPVTFGFANGIPGGAVLPAFEQIKTKLGEDFWRARVIYATNPFNDGIFMQNWLEVTLPAWFTANGIPDDTPVMFTEYGRSSDEVVPPGPAGQANWVEEQFMKVWEPKPSNVNFLGTCAFVNEYRFWLLPPEPGFALTDFDQGPGTWDKPPIMFVHKERYWNPNGNEGKGAMWEARFQVDPQRPRPAYCRIAQIYGGTAICP